MATMAERAWPTDAPGYTRTAIWLHWITAVLIVANLATGLLHETLLKGSIPLHKSIGMTVLVLALARLAWRLTHRAPPLPRDIPGWQRGLAHASHWLFYVFIILVPLTGWVFTSASPKRHPLDWFGLFPLPYFPVAPGPGVGDSPHTAHVYMGYALLALLVVHIAAALKHHFVDRDVVLARMTPGVRPPP